VYGEKSILGTLQFAAVKVSHRLKLSRTDRQVDRVHAFAVQINLCDTKGILSLCVASQQSVTGQNLALSENGCLILSIFCQYLFLIAMFSVYLTVAVFICT